ncbi:Cdc6/Cdc18 family protein [Haloarchaeobius sp. HRN-SO-5]|uniref:Cdc6/Cdc18 family protein n=1 Tax=Haloarchaeobius sp. HRN-SO-5 TaxID=3446118 RepID=UPI003EC009F0
MITDSVVFDEHYIPRELAHREEEVGTLVRAWNPLTVDDPVADVLLAGPSGVGKTVLTTFALRNLTRENHVPYAHVGAMGQTTGDVLRDLLGQIGGHPLGDETVTDLTWTVRNHLDDPGICVLDEADDLPDSDTLDTLTSIDGLSLVVITHDRQRWLGRVDPDLQHRFSVDGHELSLDRYGVDELADVLEARATAGLRSGVVRRDQLERIADDVAGVARVGIQSLHAAAELATSRGHERIEPGDVDDSYDRARHRIRQENLSSLTFHHQVLYELIRDADELTGIDLHRRYDMISKQAYRGRRGTPISERARRNKLSKLADHDLIEVIDGRATRRYRVVDDRVESPRDVPLQPDA